MGWLPEPGADSRKVSLEATEAALRHSMSLKASWLFQTHIMIMAHNNDLRYQKKIIFSVLK